MRVWLEVQENSSTGHQTAAEASSEQLELTVQSHLLDIKCIHNPNLYTYHVVTCSCSFTKNAVIEFDLIFHIVYILGAQSVRVGLPGVYVYVFMVPIKVIEVV